MLQTTFFENYLVAGKQKVILDGRFSEFADVSKGVPQGSILGPILYTIYTSSLPSLVKNCNVQMYADDTKVL